MCVLFLVCDWCYGEIVVGIRWLGPLFMSFIQRAHGIEMLEAGWCCGAHELIHRAFGPRLTLALLQISGILSFLYVN